MAKAEVMMGGRWHWLATVAALLGAAAAPTQAPTYRSAPERQYVTEDRDFGPWIGPYRQKLAPGLLRDFGERYLYAAADRALPPPAPGERRVVFLGDSITDNWDLARFFPGKPYVNRGIGSQVTAQMLLRFEQDVVGLKPAAVVILSGINDLQGVLQLETDEGIKANWRAMADLAAANGIRPIFATITPVNNYTDNARRMLAERRPERIRALNAWLARFCRERGYPLIDYYDALVDASGLLARELTVDGLHPLNTAYARMAPLAEAAIGQALRGPAPSPRP